MAEAEERELLLFVPRRALGLDGSCLPSELSLDAGGCQFLQSFGSIGCHFSAAYNTTKEPIRIAT
jgi:hypothetical protein